jgi:hypothetical protein
MIPQNKYRIDEYQISEFSDGRIWWTSHSGFAIQIGGQCYVLGNVLLSGDRRSEENGFMKSEFLDYLKKLPLWNKTQYYWSSSSLMDTATGKHLDAERLQQLGYPHNAICTNTTMSTTGLTCFSSIRSISLRSFSRLAASMSGSRSILICRLERLISLRS